ncbi:hypothetical protein SAPIO_CDS2248 [Scedosporium apiospermum]|uniref:Xylanolytic transcriptional activator regulatory domain-containing protein n=1 Tax=Pseudallescheria apiosperma TaxID=563466 RepID=A0A084GC41_PSEDA|nr:uncharacterized protein SAPIO_CDS2248 [Scedosporium apiospermum]KEZ44903.1 hypothetical protein SAPIO_CDS2248 [Scedosporium apiospermum]
MRYSHVACEVPVSKRGKYQRKRSQNAPVEVTPPVHSDPSPGNLRAQLQLEIDDGGAAGQSPGDIGYHGVENHIPASTTQIRTPSTLLTPLPASRVGESQTIDRTLLVYPISDAINTKAWKLSTTRNLPVSSLRAETARMFEAGELSPLLFQAMLFIGSSYCEEEIVRSMGFKDRPEAKAALYHRVRLLYDADWESNKVAVLQSLFLTSFWRAGPLNEKNTRYWLGAAISLAQTRGFHRTPLYFQVRDRQSSASLGLPSRIRDEDCDVEMLSPSDLEETEGIGSDIFGTGEPGHVMYALEMAKLAKLLGHIITNQFTPGTGHLDKNQRSSLLDALVRWKSELPDSLRECELENRPGMIWTYLLHLYYNNLLILLHRRAYVRPQDESDTQAGEVALRAACRITRIVEDMLSSDLIRITSLFSSLCIHTISLQRSKNTARRLAEHRAQMSLLGLKEIQKYWEVNNLVLELFFQYLDESTAKRLRAAELDPTSDTAAAANNPVVQAAGHNSSGVGDMATMAASTAADDNDDTTLGTYPTMGQDSLCFVTPSNILCQNSTSDPYAFLVDSEARVNDGLDMLGLQFLQRCL